MADSQTETFQDSWPLDEKETEALVDFLPVQSQFFEKENDFDSVLVNGEAGDKTDEEMPQEVLEMPETAAKCNDESQQKDMIIIWCSGSPLPAPEIPSKEKYRRWIHAARPTPCRSVIPTESKPRTATPHKRVHKVGKWLLFLDIVHRCEATGMTLHDYAWQFVEELVKNGVLFDAKCSTVKKGTDEAFDKSHKGVICCYTVDYTDKRDVKRAADAIRRAVHYPFAMFYKTDRDTGAGNYSHTGQKHISTYKHTADRKLYERDPKIKFKWNLVDV